MKLSELEAWGVVDVTTGLPLRKNKLKQWLKNYEFKVAGAEVSFAAYDRYGVRRRLTDKASVQGQVLKVQSHLRFKHIVDALKGFHWLTFETLFNHKDYWQSNQKLELGRYTMPIQVVDINIAEQIPPHLAAVLPCFFPDTPVDILKQRAKKAYTDEQLQEANDYLEEVQKALNQPRAAVAVGGRGRLRVVQKPPLQRVIFPFNYIHNGDRTRAVGKALLPEFDVAPLEATWEMWNTASRSKIVRIAPVSNDRRDITVEEQQRSQGREPLWWPHTYQSHTKKGAAYQGHGNEGHHLDLATAGGLFSIKTGVEFIGSSYQGAGEGNKDLLEKNCHTARLRSDYILAEDGMLKPDDEFAIQHELLSVTIKCVVDRNNRDAEGDASVYPLFPSSIGRDGFAVRDLSCLDATKIYFPPLSIPVAGSAFVLAYNERHSRYPETVASFWGKHYAETLGRVKAKVLLRYGIQFTTPNPQNFLLEFSQNLEPTGRLILRDIGDANLHRDVVMALHNGRVENRMYVFDNEYLTTEYDLERNLLFKPYDTETDKKGRNTAYPAGTQFHWHNYSTFKGRYLDETGQAFCTDDVMILWGCLHDDAYVAYLNEALKLGLPEHYEGVLPTTLAQAKEQELTRAEKVHQALTSRDGKNAIKEFRKTLLK